MSAPELDTIPAPPPAFVEPDGIEALDAEFWRAVFAAKAAMHHLAEAETLADVRHWTDRAAKALTLMQCELFLVPPGAR